MKFEYVASGMGYTRSPDITNMHPLMDEVIKDHNAKYPNHQFSMLFNAYTEKKVGVKMRGFPSLYEVHADSGGLQIMTCGKENTPEIRDAVYRVQSNSSSIAMCFDEIFIENNTTHANSRLDMSQKVVITAKAYSSGVKAGKNIKRQIDVMREEKSDCRPMMILQGNSFEDYKNYYEGMRSQLPDEYLNEIKGVAPAWACLGNGILETADMISMIKRLDLPDNLRKKIHLLGVGSTGRILPVLMLIKSGYLEGIEHISYDSTSHTSAMVMGKFSYYNRSEHRMKSFGAGNRIVGNNQKIVDMIWERYSMYIEKIATYEKFQEVFLLLCKSYASISVKEIGQEDSDIGHFGAFLTLMYQVQEFTDFVDDFMAAEDITPFIQKRHFPLYTLRNVKTVADYEKWGKFARANRLHSNRIKRDVDVPKVVSLDLFGI